MKQVKTVMLGILLILCALQTASFGAKLFWIGPVDGNYSSARDVSNNGVVVGEADDCGLAVAFRWENGVLQYLDTLGGDSSTAHGISADGLVVVGAAQNEDREWRAVLWENGMVKDLGTLGGAHSYGYDVSADGTVAVGMALNERKLWRAFLWVSGVMRDLGTLDGSYDCESQAIRVSADGSVVVGDSQKTARDSWHAFVWTQQTGMQNLGLLGKGASQAFGVSADGNAVVGYSQDSRGQARAFLWTKQTGMQNLGTLGGDRSTAHDVSADGSVVVGTAQISGGYWRAFVWTAQKGIQDLNSAFVNLLVEKSYLQCATAISPNGRYIVGFGYNAQTGREEAFLLDLEVE